MNKIARIINPVPRIRSVIELSRDVNLLATLYWNFKLFPYKIARRLPLFIGYNVDIQNAKSGGVKILSETIKRGMVKIGITPLPTFPSKGLHTLIRFHGNGSISFGKDVSIMKGCSLIATYGGQIEIGDDVLINQHTLIYSNASIKICDHIRIGWKVQIYDSPVHCVININTGEIKDPKRPVIISDNVWIGNHATISAGARIPPFTIVASHSLVNKNFMDGAAVGGMISGIPAKYKEVGLVRLLNDSIEFQLKINQFGKAKQSYVRMTDLGYCLSPFNGDQNVLFRSR